MDSPAAGPAWLVPRSAYIHIPFCAHHCGYCDFAVTAGQDHLIDLYLEALALELSRCGVYPRGEMRSLFLGGGTPSHLNARQLELLFTHVNRWLPRGTGAETSLEANPDSFGEEKAKLLAGFGVNRVSLGVQSFNPHVLRVLERRHEPAHVVPAVEAAKKHNGRVSIDLIFGVPCQSFEDWDADLCTALALEPEQISTYGLTFEKGTRLWKQQQRGEVRSLDEEMELRMYRHARFLALLGLMESAVTTRFIGPTKLVSALASAPRPM
jgi:oxygen-independent coproporphyrinogen-3 oxidase